MFHRLLALGKGLVCCAAALLAASSVQAQTSALGHVPARTTYAPRLTATAPPFQIYPGDRMFQATMKIEHYYQDAERAAPLAAYHPPAWRSSVREEAAPVEVSITEPERPTEMVAIRGPNGEVRSFPLVGGRKAIKARTIIVRPGQSLNLVVYGGRISVTRK
jgi:hypothetical protein